MKIMKNRKQVVDRSIIIIIIIISKVIWEVAGEHVIQSKKDQKNLSGCLKIPEVHRQFVFNQEEPCPSQNIW